MEYQKIINLVDNTSNQLSKFRAKNWIEINVQSREVIIPVVTLDLRPQCSSLVHVNIVMQTYLLKEQKQLLKQEMMLQQYKQMKEIKV